MSEVKFIEFWVSILDATGDAVDVSNKPFLDKSKYHTDIHVIEHAALAAKDEEIKQLQNELAEKDAVIQWYGDYSNYNHFPATSDPNCMDFVGFVEEKEAGDKAREVIKKYKGEC